MRDYEDFKIVTGRGMVIRLAAKDIYSAIRKAEEGGFVVESVVREYDSPAAKKAKRRRDMGLEDLTPQNKVVVGSVAALGLGALLLMWRDKAAHAAYRQSHSAM